MPYTEEQRTKLADVVRRARLVKQLDKEPAARDAGVSSITWKRVEDGEGVRDASLGKILAALGLPAADDLLGGSVEPPADEPAASPTNDGTLFIHSVRRFWNRVMALVENQPSPDVDRVVVAASDVLGDVLLALNAGTAARPLLDTMFFEAREAVNRLNTEGEVDDVEAETKPDASAKAVEGKEVKLRDEPQPPLAAGTDWSKQDPGVRRDEDGEHGHHLPGG